MAPYSSEKLDQELSKKLVSEKIVQRQNRKYGIIEKPSMNNGQANSLQRNRRIVNPTSLTLQGIMSGGTEVTGRKSAKDDPSSVYQNLPGTNGYTTMSNQKRKISNIFGT